MSQNRAEQVMAMILGVTSGIMSQPEPIIDWKRTIQDIATAPRPGGYGRDKCGNPKCGKMFNMRDPLHTYCSKACKKTRTPRELMKWASR